MLDFLKTRINDLFKPKQKKAVFITCNNQYVPKAIVALLSFTRYNPDYDRYILGSVFTQESYSLCHKYGVALITEDLHSDFPNLEKRPYGQQYPIECFYHFYAYKRLDKYKFIINIEPDIYTNKALDIDLSSVEFIAGSFCEGVRISNFSAIVNDLSKINQIYKEPLIDQHRILGGFRIYNTKNLKQVSFYEKIVEYYQNSWEINAPRCGDDSLMVFYQSCHPGHIQLLKDTFHIVFAGKLKMEDIPEIYHFHFGGPSIKWWKGEAQPSEIAKYFNDKYIEFLYNNFDSTYIKNHFPAIYKAFDENMMIRFYYWNGSINFGDLITPYFLDKYCNKSQYSFDFSESVCSKIISCGSIMRLCNEKSIVYGSGIRNIDQDIKPGIIQLVRGPLTRKRLLEIGCYCPPIYGDPALILPFYYKPSIRKKYKLGIIPHYTHYKKVHNLYEHDKNVLIIDLTKENIETVIDDILSCSVTVSSSLHGLIVSDAYNIPNKWIQFDDNLRGDGTKFHDYFQSVKRKDINFIDARFYEKRDIQDIISQITPVQIEFDFTALKESMFFDENGIKNYTKYLVSSIT